MNDMFNHIFNDLDRLENSRKNIVHAINDHAKRGRRLDKKVRYIILASCMWELSIEIRISQMNEKINVFDRRLRDIEERITKDKEG